MTIPKGPRLSLDEIRAIVEEEIPYVVGEGNKCINQRATRTKKLMRANGHPIYTRTQSIFEDTDYSGPWRS